MSRFIIESIIDVYGDEKYLVREKDTGWFYPNLTHTEANFLCDKFNEVCGDLE